MLCGFCRGFAVVIDQWRQCRGKGRQYGQPVRRRVFPGWHGDRHIGILFGDGGKSGAEDAGLVSAFRAEASVRPQPGSAGPAKGFAGNCLQRGAADGTESVAVLFGSESAFRALFHGLSFLILLCAEDRKKKGY